MDDKQALDRYRYMLRTAPPDDIERAHQEAFAQLTPEQRAAALRQLAEHVPSSDVGGDDPKSLARAATRAEMREPGTLERAFGGAGAPGLGSMFLSTSPGRSSARQSPMPSLTMMVARKEVPQGMARKRAEKARRRRMTRAATSGMPAATSAAVTRKGREPFSDHGGRCRRCRW